jgi:hypothetical protein
MAKVLWVFCMALLLFSLEARAGWKLISPKQESDVKSGELLIAVQLDQSTKVNKSSLQFFVDDRYVTTNIKVTETKITLLYLSALKNGKHNISIKGTAEGEGELPTLNCDFYVGRPRPDQAGNFDSIVNPRKTVELSGNITAEHKRYDVSGPGSWQRQYQPYVDDISVDAVLRIGKVRFPVRYYNTTDQYTYPIGLQSRNFFQTGIQTNSVELLYGDMNPMFDRLILTGTRINGLRFAITRKRFNLQIIDGYSALAAEGQVVKYDPNSGVLPANLKADSTYFIPGTYKRKISAMRMSFGNLQEGSQFSITLLRSRDLVNSIQYGASPKDNMVGGLDEQFVTNENKVRVNTGIAFSMITNDISHGVATKREIDSLNGTSYGIEPADYKDIFILNTTTVKPDFKSSTAGYFNTSWRTKYQNFTLDYHYFGSAYQSFGNPYLLTDLQIASLADQISMFKRKVTLNARYAYQDNNLSNVLASTIVAHTGSINLFVAPKPNLPQFGILCYSQYRITPPNPSKLIEVNDLTTSLTGTVNYNFKAFKALHGISLQYTQNLRTDKVNDINSNETQIFGGGLNEMITPLHLMLDLHYSTMYYLSSQFGNQPLSDAYDGRIRYEFRKIKTFIGGGVYLNKLHSSGYNPPSNRIAYAGNLSSQILKNAVLDIEAGFTPYKDLISDANNYNEFFANFRLSYNFDFK